MLTQAAQVKEQLNQGHPFTSRQPSYVARLLANGNVSPAHEKAVHNYVSCSMPSDREEYLPAVFTYSDGSALVLTESFLYLADKLEA